VTALFTPCVFRLWYKDPGCWIIAAMAASGRVCAYLFLLNGLVYVAGLVMGGGCVLFCRAVLIYATQ
jgi:hypothetical protein